LITGGARSGKSRYALSLAQAHRGSRAFIATAEPFDDEMQVRIRKHREERGVSFITIEEPLELTRTIDSLPADVKIAIVDCLTVWLGNLLHYQRDTADDYPEITRFVELLDRPPCDLIIVSNEVGMGIVPQNDTARRFRDLCGQMNEHVAERSDRVILMVCGIPITVKGGKT